MKKIKEIRDGKALLFADYTDYHVRAAMRICDHTLNPQSDGSKYYVCKKDQIPFRWIGSKDPEFRMQHLPVYKSREIIDEYYSAIESAKYPKEMWVWDDYNSEKYKRVVFTEKDGKYLAWIGAETIEESNSMMYLSVWKFAEDVEEEVHEVTPAQKEEPISEAYLNTTLKEIIEKVRNC